ncbi:MAG: M4 family metallopeptidase, partial [Actinomycetota bacterium]|nr:M4 family metallopeptidase [Actinomycetota bacterium]
GESLIRRAAVLGAMLLVASLLAGIPASAAKPRSLRVVKARGTDAPVLVSGISARPETGPAPTVATDHLNQNPARYGIADPQQELSPLEVVAHEGGRTVRFQQRHRGVPVFGAHYLVHLDDTDDGKRVTTVNGDFFTELEVAVEPRVSPADAHTLALASTRSLRRGSAQDHGLVVLPVGEGVLAYHLTVQGEGLGAPLREQVFVNAVTGHVVLSYNDIKTAEPVDGTGESVKEPNPTVDLSVSRRDNGVYQMRKLAPVEIVTHDAEDADGNTFAPDGASLVKSSESHFSGEDTDSGAVDAHWGAQEVFDFYETLEPNSLDGLPLVSVVNASDRGAPLFNAFWNGEHVTFGNPRPGPADGLYPLSAAPDIVAHEFTHGVNQVSAKFVYLNQSGALDEAYADYFGNAIEVTAEGMQMTDPEASQVGEDVCKEDGATPSQWTCPFLRDLNEEDPSGNPRGTDDYLYYLYDFDNGGVHDNATIYGGALWEIREDLAEHPDFDPLLADRIMYRALTFHAPLDSFYDGRLLVRAAAQEVGSEVGLSESQQDDVNDIVDRSFDDRGIDATWDAGTGNDTLVLLDDTSPQGFVPSVPQVSGNTFVTVHHPNLTKSGKLFMGDVTGAGDPRKITGSQSNESIVDEQPDIGGGEIVWSRLPNSGGFDIDVIGTRNGPDSALRTVAGTFAWEWYPSVDGNLVAWENLGSQTDIYARYGGGRLRRLTQTSGNEFDPQVAGDTVAWWDVRRRVGRIQVKNLRTGRKATIKLTRPPSSAEIGPPALTSRYVFWYEDRDGDGRGAIKRSNHRGNKKKTLVSESSPFAPVSTGFVAGLPRPSANNSWVAYTTEAGFVGGSIPSDEVGRDIFLVPSGGGTPKPVTCNRGDQAYPAVGRGQRAVWLDASRGQTDLVTWPPGFPPSGCP